MLSFTRFYLLSLIVIGLAFSLSNCKTKKPTSDSTAPVVTWSVINNSTGKKQEIVGDGKIDAKPGDSFKVSCIAEDPEGIHEITLGGDVQWTCRSGNIASTSGPSLETTDKQTLNPDSNGEVLTKIFLIRDVKLGPFQCQPGMTFTGARTTLRGTGENYFNGVTKAQLDFVVTP